LAALVAGYEVAVSLAEVLHPHASRRGFQTTGVVGAVGAAAAVAKVLGLNVERIEKAMGVAASSGAGLFAYLTGGGNIKKLHPAHAAREGAFAALLAERDIVEGPLAVAETKAGIFHAFGGLYPRTGSVPRHGAGTLAIARCYLKPYPCCRHIHPALDALLALRAKHGIVADDVASVEIGTYTAAMPHATLGWDSFTTAQLSFPYVMAIALRHGVVDLTSFGDDSRSDCRVTRDAAKVQVREDPECCEAYPRHGPARVTVVMQDGTRFERCVADPVGCPEVPLSEVALFEKFRMMVAEQWSAEKADQLIAIIWNLEALDSIRPFVERLCASGGAATVPEKSLLQEAS
jgi:2-methylcitrate dehydratase PrpD